jgi:hypothetical protein
MKTKAIKLAAQNYLAARNAPQPKGVYWDKEASQEPLFDAMKAAGLTGCSAMAGTHMGTKTNEKSTKLYVIDIGDSVTFNLYNDFNHYWDCVCNK